MILINTLNEVNMNRDEYGYPELDYEEFFTDEDNDEEE